MSFSLSLFRYPVGYGRALLAGTLPLRYCFDRFACRTPTWRFPAFGGAGDLVTANVADRHEVVPAAARREVFGVRNSGLRRKRIRLNRKTPAHLAGFDVQSRPWISLVILFLVTRGGAVIRIMRGLFLLRAGQGWVNSLGCTCPRLQACMFRNQLFAQVHVRGDVNIHTFSRVTKTTTTTTTTTTTNNNKQQQTTTNNHHQPPPTTTNHHQPPAPTTNNEQQEQ